MNKRMYFFVGLLLMVTMAKWAEAQSKMLDISDLQNRKLMPSGLSGLQWCDATSYSWYAGQALLRQRVDQTAPDTLLALARLNSALKNMGKAELKSFAGIAWMDSQKFRFVDGNEMLAFSLPDNTLQRLQIWDKKAENTDYHPASGQMAYTVDNNLLVATATGQRAITHDADTGIVNGQSVHRNEFGITKGTFWSPSGQNLAFYRMDESMVSQYPLVDIDERVASIKYIRYPMAGMKSHEVRVGVYNLASDKVVFMQTGLPADQYLTNITWSPDEKYLYIAVLNRDQDHLWLNRYDVATGVFDGTLFEETDPQYVEPLNGPLFVPGNEKQLIWQSRRDGYNHLYLYNTGGKMLRQLTQGNWEVTSVQGFDASGKKLYYVSTEESPITRQAYLLDLAKASHTRLTVARGTHSVTLSPDGKYFFDRFSSLNTGLVQSLCEANGKEVRLLAENRNPLSDYAMGSTKLLALKAFDGSDLFARIILPPAFDSTRKYPTLVYVYGGPHSQLVSDTWLGGSNLYFNFLAQQGYIVWTLDNHGTSFRGADFEQAIHRHLGDLETDDQMLGVNYLKALPYVDTTRMGVDGWSYGGFMVLNLMLRHPGVFKVASCGGPVTDWKYYEVMYGERYMDTPEQNPDGYKNASLLEKTDQLRGKLLIIHGAQDNTVVWQHSLKLLENFVSQGKQVDYFVYPTHEHNVIGPDRLHLYKKLFGYYEQNLKPLN